MPSLAGTQNAYWNRYAGDVGDYIEAFVTGIANNLDAISAVTGEVINQADSTSVNLTGSVVDSAAFRVRINLGTWLQSTAQPGEVWELRIKLNDGSTVRTWPDHGMAMIGVK